MTQPSDNNQASWIYVTVISMVAAVGGFLFGYDLQIISGAILYLSPHFKMTPEQEAFAMSSALMGCLFGPLVGSYIADSRLGRKWSLMVAAALFLVSAIGTAIPQTLFQFNVFRFIGGVGVGLASIVSPMYIAEISPARIRGALVSINQLMIVVGLFIASLVSWKMAQTLPETSGWRWMFASETVPIAILMLGLIFIPRSPRWLVQRGRMEEGEHVLTKIDGRASAVREIAEIRQQLSEEQGTWRELLVPGVRIALLIAVALAFFQQWTGVSPSIFYMPKIFEMIGFTKDNAIKQLVIANAVNIVMTIVALLVLDRLGRRPVLLIGLIGMCVGMASWGFAFHFGAPGYVILITFMIALCSYLVSLAPLGWLIMSEVFPARLRAKGMAVASVTLWLATFSSVYLLNPFLTRTAERFGSPGPAFWVFSLICLIAWIFFYRIMPETKGYTLEEIGERFLHGRMVKKRNERRPSSEDDQG
jgi:SP family arabinose:H+ symporter-like MFS transporter